jgi:hypothetical protein
LPRLERLVAIPVRKIRQFVPSTLSPNIKRASNVLAADVNKELAKTVHQMVLLARSAWEEGREDTQDRSHLREQILKVAYLSKQEGYHEIYNALLTDLAQLGSF